jgi:hypothetical protein
MRPSIGFDDRGNFVAVLPQTVAAIDHGAMTHLHWAAAAPWVALALGLATFWWKEWRRGRIICPQPKVFAALLGDTPMLRLPLALVNTGPRVMVITDMRLWFPDIPDAAFGLHWRRTLGELLGPAGHAEPLPLVLPPRGADLVLAEFGDMLSRITFIATDHPVRVEVKLAGRKDTWRRVGEFPLRVGGWIGNDPAKWTAYYNADGPPSKEQVERVGQLINRLAAQLHLNSGDQ